MDKCIAALSVHGADSIFVPMETAFPLKRTVIGGQTAPDDWSVLLNGAVVGGIHPVVGNPSAVDQWRRS
jgi:hypothetical protein